MTNRTAIFLIILLLAITGCSKEAGEKSSQSGDALLKPDNGYIILLGTGMDTSSPVGNVEYESLTLIAGGQTRKFGGLKGPVISSNGHLVGINKSDETAVYYRDEESPYKFVAVEGEDKNSINGGIGISNSGKRVYRLGIEPVELDGEKYYAVRLVEFDTDHRRVQYRRTICKYSAERFEKDRMGITYSLMSPLIVSQNGETVYITSVEIDDKKRENDGVPPDWTPYKAPANLGIGVNSYVYNRKNEDFDLCLGFAENGYSEMHQIDVSRNGRVTLFTARKPGGPTSLVVMKDPAKPPQVIAVGDLGGIHSPRLSPVGSHVGYFTDALDTVKNAVIISSISKRKDIRLRIDRVDQVFWTDDLKYVAYVSHTFKSSIVKEGKTSEPLQGDAWYLHFVNIETLDDTVIYVSYGEDPPKIIDIVAESDEFKDKTKSKPRFPPQEGGKGGGAGDGVGKGKKKYGTAEGPSISAK